MPSRDQEQDESPTLPPDWRRLIELLGHEASSTRDVARDALVRRARGTPEVIDELIKIIEGSSIEEAFKDARFLAAVQTVSKFGEQVPVRRVLIRVLSHEDAPAQARQQVMTVFRTDSLDVSLLRAVTIASRSDDGDVRLEAAALLKQATAAPDAREPLEALSQDDNPNIRNQALLALFNDPARWSSPSDEVDPASAGDREAIQASDSPVPVSELLVHAERALDDVREAADELRQHENTRLGQAALDFVLELVDETYEYVGAHIDSTETMVEQDAVGGWSVRVAILYRLANVLLKVEGAQDLARRIAEFAVSIGG